MNMFVVLFGCVGLLLLLSGQMLLFIDILIINVVLDVIIYILVVSVMQLEFIVVLYGVVFVVCLVMGSKFGDNYGCWCLFMWGVVFFGIVFLLCGMVNSIGVLLVVCILQGVGVVLIVLQIFVILYVIFKGFVYVWVISLYGGIGGIVFIVGQMGGGWLVLVDIVGLGWCNVFFINVLICLLVLVLSCCYVLEICCEMLLWIDWQGMLYFVLIFCCLLFLMVFGLELYWLLWLQLMLVVVLLLLFVMCQSVLCQQQCGDYFLLLLCLLQLISICFGMVIVLLFFGVWFGFMFCMVLIMQEGLGMVLWQFGNSFIVFGVVYFILVLYVLWFIVCYSMGWILLIGLVVQIVGFLLLCVIFFCFGVVINVLMLVFVMVLIGYGQVLIVNSFYWIGMCDISVSDVGVGSVIFSILQQVIFGFGLVIFGLLFLVLVCCGGGNYLQVLIDFLLVEVVMMLLLGVIVLWLCYYFN